MNKEKTPEIEIIDLEVYKHEIEWTIRQLKVSCSTSGKIPTKDPYLLEINKFFSEFMGKVSEKIYSEIILIKEGKKHSLSKEKVKNAIDKTINELIEKYISVISEKSESKKKKTQDSTPTQEKTQDTKNQPKSLYEKYNLNEDDKIACEISAKKIGNSSAEKIYLRYCDHLKNNRTSFWTLLFAFIAALSALPALKGVVILSIDSFKHFF